MPRFAKLTPEQTPVEVREARRKRKAHSELARAEIEANVEPITRTVIEKAKQGDMRAARLALDKVIGPARSEPGVRIENINNPDAQVAADSVMAYLERGEINAEQAVSYLTAVEKRTDIRLLGQGLTINGEQFMRLMHLREMLRGRPFAPLVPSVTIGA